jgi:hypothetical protein
MSTKTARIPSRFRGQRGVHQPTCRSTSNGPVELGRRELQMPKSLIPDDIDRAVTFVK